MSALNEEGNRHTVAIVEDDVALARLLQMGLESVGYQVVVAHDGRSAVELVREQRPSLVLLDAMLPALDGFGVLGELRSAPETEKTPVVFVSARNHPDVIMQALEAGATGFISKPFEINDVVAEVDRIIAELKKNSQ